MERRASPPVHPVRSQGAVQKKVSLHLAVQLAVHVLDSNATADKTLGSFQNQPILSAFGDHLNGRSEYRCAIRRASGRVNGCANQEDDRDN